MWPICDSFLNLHGHNRLVPRAISFHANAPRPERVGGRIAAGVRSFGSYGSLGTACAVATRILGFPGIAAGISPYIDVFGPSDLRRMLVIRTSTSTNRWTSATPRFMSTGGAAHCPTDGPRRPRPGNIDRRARYHRVFRSCGPTMSPRGTSEQRQGWIRPLRRCRGIPRHDPTSRPVIRPDRGILARRRPPAASRCAWTPRTPLVITPLYSTIDNIKRQ